MRVFLDPNVVVSAFTARGLSADVFRFILAKHEMLIGEVVLQEFHRIMHDRMAVPADEIREAESLLRGQIVIPRPNKVLDIPIRDPDDKWILASAVVGKADVLVTGDKDLLSLTDPPLPILSPRSFWERLLARE